MHDQKIKTLIEKMRVTAIHPQQYQPPQIPNLDFNFTIEGGLNSEEGPKQTVSLSERFLMMESQLLKLQIASSKEIEYIQSNKLSREEVE